MISFVLGVSKKARAKQLAVSSCNRRQIAEMLWSRWSMVTGQTSRFVKVSAKDWVCKLCHTILPGFIDGLSVAHWQPTGCTQSCKVAYKLLTGLNSLNPVQLQINPFGWRHLQLHDQLQYLNIHNTQWNDQYLLWAFRLSFPSVVLSGHFLNKVFFPQSISYNISNIWLCLCQWVETGQ